MALPVDDGDQIPEPTTPPLPMLLGASCTGGQSIPIHVLRAIHHKGDLDTVARWFDAAPTRDIDETFTLTQPYLRLGPSHGAVNGYALLNIVTSPAVYLEGHVELVRWLLSRGADVNTRTEDGWSPLDFACERNRCYWSPGSVPYVHEVILLLIRAGAMVDTLAPSKYTPLGACLDRFRGRISEEERLRGLEFVVRELLRAGASLDWCDRTTTPWYGTASCLIHHAVPETRLNPSRAWPRCKLLVEGVHKAGSYKAFFARSRREVLTLRALALKGRAETADAVLSFVFGLPDGVAWNILSFWRCYYRISVAGDIHWHAGPW